VVLAVLVAILFCYALAMLPGLLEEGTEQEIASLVFYRLAALGPTGLFLVYVAKGVLPAGLTEDYATDDDGSVLLERVEEELAARKGVPVGVILVDPGGDLEAVEILLERVWSRSGEPVLLGEGNLFGVVVSGVDDGRMESAARPRRRELPRRAGHKGWGGDLPTRRPFRRGLPHLRRARPGGRLRGRVTRRYSPRRHGRTVVSSTLRLTPSLVSTLRPFGLRFQPSPFRPRPAACGVSLSGAIGYDPRGDAPGRLAELLKAADRRETAC
jgi:hypothetical protein